jgi:hypothetical protein
LHESNIKIYWCIYITLVQQTMQRTKLSHTLKPHQTKTSINFNRRGLHLNFVNKVGISVFLLYTPHGALFDEPH